MNSGAAILTTTGDTDDVAAFFHVSIRTIANWKSANPPVLAYWQEGRNVCFGEEAVVDLRVKFFVAAQGMQPGEARELARKEWREHLRIRRDDLLGRKFEELQAALNAVRQELKQVQGAVREVAMGKESAIAP